MLNFNDNRQLMLKKEDHTDGGKSKYLFQSQKLYGQSSQ